MTRNKNKGINGKIIYQTTELFLLLTIGWCGCALTVKLLNGKLLGAFQSYLSICINVHKIITYPRTYLV